MTQPIRVGSRNSALALRQTEGVIESLKRNFPQKEFRLDTIQTSGDRVKDWSKAKSQVGLFVKEIEEALLAGHIDMAVHSLKDMPCQTPKDLEIGAVCERLDAREVLIANETATLDSLKPGARIGVSSVRRRAQILSIRNDLELCEFRGNVDTRLRKLRAGEADALILAAAGLLRLDLKSQITEWIPLDRMLPAPCQGALAVEIRKGDSSLAEVLKKIDHEPTRVCTSAERFFMRELGGGCSLPVGAFAVVHESQLTLTAEISSPDGTRCLKKKVIGSPNDPEGLGRRLALEFLSHESGWVKSILRMS